MSDFVSCLAFRFISHCGSEELRVLAPASSDVPRDSGAKLHLIDEQTNKTDKYTTRTATQNSQRQRSELES